MEELNQFQPTLTQKAISTTSDVISETAEYLASFSIGQAVLKQTDRVLWTIEKCAEWSVPNQPQNKHHQQNGTFGKPAPLIRPLPWIFFLPMLLFIRILRLSLNIGALLLGFESVKPVTMVKFIQVRRRRIRALKFLGLRRARHGNIPKEHEKSTMTLRERFYNIMSRAMCFRVTNSDLNEEITILKEDNLQSEQSSSNSAKKTAQKNVTGKDLKRKYIEILKNNYYDWEDIEDDEELIDRITQLAEDDIDDEDPNYVPAEDSATEDDSMSDAEEDAISSENTNSSPNTSSPKQIQRLSSHGSLANEIIEELNEESDTSTVSANSDDESTQQLEKVEDTKSPEETSNSGATSNEEFHSIPTSPEPKSDTELPKNNTENQNDIEEFKKIQKNTLINPEITDVNSG